MLFDDEAKKTKIKIKKEHQTIACSEVFFSTTYAKKFRLRKTVRVRVALKKYSVGREGTMFRISPCDLVITR